MLRAPITLLALLPVVAVAAEDAELPRTLFQEAAEVTVVNVDVVVLDADGRPVTGLQRHDFTVLENGRPVEVTNFYAADRPLAGGAPDAAGGVSPPTPPAPPRLPGDVPADEGMTLVVYVDSTALEPRHRAAAIERVRGVVLAGLGPDARVMVVGAEGEPVVYQPLTSAPIEVMAALDRLASRVAPRTTSLETELREALRAIAEIDVEAGSGYLATKASEGYALMLQEDEQEGVDEALAEQTELATVAALPQVRAYAAQRRAQVVETLRALRSFLELAGGLPGRKALLYVGDGLTSRPGGALFDALQERLTAMPGLAASALVGGEGEDLTPLFTDVATVASTSGVAIYTLDPGAEAFLERGSAAETAGAGGNYATWRDSVRGDLQIDRQERLIQLAEDTGGRVSLAKTGDDALARGLAADFAHYYALGYPADPRLGADAVREIEVRVADPSWTVHHRRRFRTRGLAERAASRTRAALVVVGEPQGLAFEVTAEPGAAQDDGTFVVPVRVAVPLGDLVLQPGLTEHRARVSVFVAARDERGRMSDVQRHACPIRIANDELLTAMGRAAACGIRLQMRPGHHRLAVSVLDELAALDGTRTVEVEVGGEAASR